LQICVTNEEIAIVAMDAKVMAISQRFTGWCLGTNSPASNVRRKMAKQANSKID